MTASSQQIDKTHGDIKKVKVVRATSHEEAL